MTLYSLVFCRFSGYDFVAGADSLSEERRSGKEMPMFLRSRFATEKNRLAEKLSPGRHRLTVRVVINLAVILILFGNITAFISCREYVQSMTDQFAEHSRQTGMTAASYINADHLADYLQMDPDGDSPLNQEYNYTLFLLRSLTKTENCTFLYALIPDEDYSNITYVFDAVNPTLQDQFPAFELGYRQEATSSDYIDAYRRAYEEGKNSSVTRFRTDSGSGPHITITIPLRDSTGKTVGVLCVQKIMDELRDPALAMIRKIAWITLLIVLISTISAAALLRFTFVLPIHRISREAERFAHESTTKAGCLDSVLKIPNEMGGLAEAVLHMEDRIEASRRELVQITADRERIASELHIAHSIQTAMLPTIFPPFPERKEFDLFACMNPAKEVGGDFYDFFLIDEDHLALVIADVSGKGVPAALFMVIAKTLIKDRTLAGGTPSEILEFVNDRLCENNSMEMFVTVWLGILTISTGELVAANAGHEYPILRKPDGTFELFRDAHGMPIATLEGLRYGKKQYQMTLEKGSGLFLYTDGGPEAINENREQYGTQRLLSVLNEHPDAAVEELPALVLDSVGRFSGSTLQFDDITLLYLIYRGVDG